MSDIEWTGLTLNPIIGCTRVRRGKDVPSGCDNCYADDQVARFEQRYYDRPTTIKLGATKKGTLTFVPKNPKTGKTLGHGAQWTGAVWLLPEVLEKPLRRKKPTTYFVNSLADWAHESIVGSERGRRFLAAMFGVMAATPQHTYQLLTKRPEQARKWFEWLGTVDAGRIITGRHAAFVVRDAMMEQLGSSLDDRLYMRLKFNMHCDAWPLPNVWLGCSVEDQPTADERIPALLKLPAAVRFLSAEPLLGPIDLGQSVPPEFLGLSRVTKMAFGSRASAPMSIDWVIVGGESGPKARQCDVGWIRSIVEQRRAAGAPVFCKQLGARPVHDGVPYALQDAKGGDMSEWPEDLRVREMPG